MENLQYAAPEIRVRVRQVKQPTRPLWPANENIPGAAAGAEDAATPAPMPPARAAQSGAGFVRRMLRAIGHRLRAWHARRMIVQLEAWPDHRLDAFGIARGEIEPAVRRLFGLQPSETGPRARAPGDL